MFPGLVIQLAVSDQERTSTELAQCLNYTSALGKTISFVPIRGQLWGNVLIVSQSLLAEHITERWGNWETKINKMNKQIKKGLRETKSLPICNILINRAMGTKFGICILMDTVNVNAT